MYFPALLVIGLAPFESSPALEPRRPRARGDMDMVVAFVLAVVGLPSVVLVTAFDLVASDIAAFEVEGSLLLIPSLSRDDSTLSGWSQIADPSLVVRPDLLPSMVDGAAGAAPEKVLSVKGEE